MLSTRYRNRRLSVALAVALAIMPVTIAADQTCYFYQTADTTVGSQVGEYCVKIIATATMTSWTEQGVFNGNLDFQQDYDCSAWTGDINHFNVSVNVRDRNGNLLGTFSNSAISGTTSVAIHVETSVPASQIDFQVSISGDLYQDDLDYSMGMYFGCGSCDP
jgi:hypothetical protein